MTLTIVQTLIPKLPVVIKPSSSNTGIHSSIKLSESAKILPPNLQAALETGSWSTWFDPRKSDKRSMAATDGTAARRANSARAIAEVLVEWLSLVSEKRARGVCNTVAPNEEDAGCLPVRELEDGVMTIMMGRWCWMSMLFARILDHIGTIARWTGVWKV